MWHQYALVHYDRTSVIIFSLTIFIQHHGKERSNVLVYKVPAIFFFPLCDSKLPVN